MKILKNPHTNIADDFISSAVPFPSDRDDRATALWAKHSPTGPTPLRDTDTIASLANVASVWIKDERARMGLGSFKALGAAYVIATDAQTGDLSDQTYVTASAGNHGMSVAWGAQMFGAKAVVYIAATVPEVFAVKLRDLGATVIREGDIYEESMAAAMKAADDNGWQLLSDSSWEGYYDRPWLLMEGYLTLMAEVGAQIPNPPTHIFLQAGVGGLAVACAAMARKLWGEAPKIIVVEPDMAPALMGSIKAGKSVVATGGVSGMGRLDCKECSLIALKGLARDANMFVTITEDEANAATALLAKHDLASTSSGTAGLAALLNAAAHRDELGLDENSCVLAILSEEAE